MIISHYLKEKISKDVHSNNLCLFLMSKRGHYLSLPLDPHENISNFNGWFNLISDEYVLYKSLDNIYLDDQKVIKPREFINHFSSVERIYDIAKERFTIVKNGLIYEVSSHKTIGINIDLDFRKIFDLDDKGRIYKIYTEDVRVREGRLSSDSKIIVVEYTKYSDDSLSNIEGRYYLLIYGAEPYFTVPDKWEKRSYEYDQSRDSKSEFYIYRALRLLCKNYSRIIFSFSENKEDAHNKLIDVIVNQRTITDIYCNYAESFLGQKLSVSDSAGREMAMGYINALHALDGILVSLNLLNKKHVGIWAGLPWFFQFWARDELISLRSLMLADKNDYAKLILMRYVNEIGVDGRIPNIYPPAGLGSADASGWLFKRIYDFIVMLDESGDFANHVNLFELKYFRERLQFSIRQIIKNHYSEGLIKNAPLETWMDTSAADDQREGFRIEIQALFLSMLKLMNMMNNMLANKFVKKDNKLVNVTSNEFDYKKLERDMARVVREHFLVKKSFDGVGGEEYLSLNDGYACSNADVMRPNIFIAYYVYPDLLHNEEWESVFDYALERLWMGWDLVNREGGGLSTIDKDHYLFTPNYTGQNNRSYHRGDSWFFVNNIAAMALFRLNKEKYFPYIKKILNASTEDILYKGFIGCASELSSGTVFKPAGCFCQAWSIATYIELIHEMFL